MKPPMLGDGPLWVHNYVPVTSESMNKMIILYEMNPKLNCKEKPEFSGFCAQLLKLCS